MCDVNHVIYNKKLWSTKQAPVEKTWLHHSHYFTFEEYYLKIIRFLRNDYVRFILGLLHIFCKIFYVSCSRPFIQGVDHYLANGGANQFECELICWFATMDHSDISRPPVTRYPVAVLIYCFLLLVAHRTRINYSLVESWRPTTDAFTITNHK